MACGDPAERLRLREVAHDYLWRSRGEALIDGPAQNSCRAANGAKKAHLADARPDVLGKVVLTPVQVQLAACRSLRRYPEIQFPPIHYLSTRSL